MPDLDKILDCIFKDDIVNDLFVPPFDNSDIDKLERQLRNFFKKKDSGITQESFANKTYAILTNHNRDKVTEVRNKKLNTTKIISHCFK